MAPMIEVPPRLSPVALEVVKLGQNGHDLEAFISASILKPVDAGVTHSDRMRVFDALLHEGCLRMENGRFFAESGLVPRWLLDGIAEGYVDADEVADGLIPSPEQRKKFDSEVLAQIGLQGERVFVDTLRSRLPEIATINHVSLFDDTLGYDVEVRLDGTKALCFEVKTTTRSSRKFPFFLSRNEAKVAATLPNLWFLGLVQILDGDATVIGTASFDTLMPRMPVDKSDDVAWASVSCTFDTSELQSLELCLKHALTQSS